MARHFLIFSIICFSSFGLLGGVNGTIDAHAGGNYNYSTAGIDDNNNNMNSKNIHGDLFEQKTGQPPNAGHEEADDSNSVHQLRLIQPAHTLKELNIVKRAPSGFTGLRGKKQNELPQNGIDWNSLDWPDSTEEESDLGSWQDYSNTWSPSSNGRRFKKAPTAFYGVRGKKFADAGNQINNLQDLMQQLQAERIREELWQDFLDRITMSSDYMNAIEKRTPAGFMGMRGKRSMPDFSTYDEDNVNDIDADERTMAHQAFKRSPPNHSFYGTRGKKQPFVDFRNKFVGVRGKKSSATTAALTRQSLTQNPEQNSELMSETDQNYDGAQSRYLVNMFPLFYDTIYKRTPNGFLGMRGKRATNADTAMKALRYNINDSALN